MNERQLKALKNTKIWNMVLLVMTAFSVVAGLIALPATLNPSRETYEILGTAGLEMYEMLNTPFHKGWTIFSLVISVLLLVLYIKAHMAIKKENVPADFIYFLTIAVQLIGLIVSFFTSSQLFIVTVVLTAIYCIFPLLALINLSKVEKNN